MPARKREGNVISSKRLSARERRTSAIHEAGHLVIAAHFGLYPVSAWIVQNEPADPDERTWIGRVQFTSLDQLAPLERRMIGVAGSVAEWLWTGGWIEDYYPEMSESDWRLAGYEPGKSDDALMDAAEEVGRLLARGGDGWQKMVAESRRLIVASNE